MEDRHPHVRPRQLFAEHDGDDISGLSDLHQPIITCTPKTPSAVNIYGLVDISDISLATPAADSAAEGAVPGHVHADPKGAVPGHVNAAAEGAVPGHVNAAADVPHSTHNASPCKSIQQLTVY